MGTTGCVGTNEQLTHLMTLYEGIGGGSTRAAHLCLEEGCCWERGALVKFVQSTGPLECLWEVSQGKLF